MSDGGDIKQHIAELENCSRNKRQASLLLFAVARDCTDKAIRKCAETEKIMKDCKATFEKSRKLRRPR